MPDDDGRTTSEGEGRQIMLPGYEAQLNDDAVLHSRNKLEKASVELNAFIENLNGCSIISLPCTTEEETLGYRCKCSFQVLYDDKEKCFHYAMRQKGEPVSLRSSTFPISNKRIQAAMEDFREKVLNLNAGETIAAFPILANKSLASLTFAASWNDATENCSEEENTSSQDCILTLNYNAALDDKEESWLEEARQVCRLLNLTQLHGRSRKLLLSAISSEQQEASALGSYLRDTICLIPPSTTELEASSWQVSLQQQHQSSSHSFIPVHYHKPEGAFFHPNARVMCQALQWMLDRISYISSSSEKKCRLLEMYCGCGAHTLALAKSGMLESQIGIELDPRLVDACKVNIDLNTNNTESESDQSADMTPVQVVRGDAGQWARKQQKKKASFLDYSILLVDPPRQGLDAQVIDLAIQVESFEHVLIISCGHQALVRDLKLLCSHFEIMNCRQLDLFPRTSSVETLVHLRRRGTEDGIEPE